ncbi:kelch-like protein 10 isoform X1 [Thunnus albacares]|uniref:kelch-like protein 10 isoform X1 n=2 Tax=Thunnus albacares TaxID=8236 RepID=UPI001CF6642A|nr:kelch-like protein 10 isoform X1 [Thunnus albacares]
MSDQGEASVTLHSHRSEMEKRMRHMTSVVLNELRLEDKLCDVVIKVGDVEFNAHKVILCSCSTYFRTLFTGSWATSEREVYVIPGVLPEIMNLIISYAYTHSVAVTKDNVVEVLAAADQFLVLGIVQACCFFLEDQLCLKNCIGIWRLVDFYHCPDLRHKVFLYILDHFQEIVHDSQELLELSVQELATIITNDCLNVRRENTVFEAILRWINHLPDQRRGYISVLLPKVRLCFMTTDYLQNSVINNALVKDSIECIPIIDNALRAFMDFRANGPSNLDYSSPLTRPRLPPVILLATGGKDGSIPVTSLQAYDVRADRWCKLSTEEICRAHHGAAVLNGFIYLIGGCSREAHLNTVQRFDLITHTWHQVAPMNFCRCFVSVAVLNGCIYALGGFNGQAYYNTVECYRHEIDQWTMVAPMRTKRCGASATTLNGKIYVCGGFNGRRSLSSAECYSPDTNQWTVISHMRTSRSGLGVVAYKDHIYAVGGTFTGASHLCSAEAYDPRTNRWNIIPSMSTPRSYFGIEVVEDQLFVVGGHDGSTAMFSVERYDEEAGMWYGASNTEMPCSGLSCCVLHGLYTVVEKLFPRDAVTLTNVEEAAGGSI